MGGGFGRVRGQVTCYNYGKLGHYARYFLDLAKTCSYCKGQDHNVEQCPQLISKWQARTIARPNHPRNANPNPNMDVQMVVVEPRYPNVDFVTREGVATGDDQDKAQEQLQPQVRPATQKKVSFDVQVQKKVFLEVRPEFVEREEPSTSKEVKEMPERFQRIFPKNVPQKVSKIKSFMSSCLTLIQDKDAIAELVVIIE